MPVTSNGESPLHPCLMLGNSALPRTSQTKSARESRPLQAMQAARAWPRVARRTCAHCGNKPHRRLCRRSRPAGSPAPPVPQSTDPAQETGKTGSGRSRQESLRASHLPVAPQWRAASETPARHRGTIRSFSSNMASTWRGRRAAAKLFALNELSGRVLMENPAAQSGTTATGAPRDPVTKVAGITSSLDSIS